MSPAPHLEDFRRRARVVVAGHTLRRWAAQAPAVRYHAMLRRHARERAMFGLNLGDVPQHTWEAIQSGLQRDFEWKNDQCWVEDPRMPPEKAP